MKGGKRIQKDSWIRYGSLAILIVVFLITFFVFGYSKYPDTKTYIKMATDREPVYPLILLLFRKIFSFAGENSYLYAVSLFQNLLMAFGIWYTAMGIRKWFSLKTFGTGFVIAVLIAPNYLTHFFSKSGLILSCSILSEGISLSLFMLFLSFLLKSVFEEKYRNRSLILTAVFSVLCTLTRSQMMFTLVVVFLVGIFLGKKRSKAFLRSIGILGASFAAVFLIGHLYIYGVYGVFTGNTNGMHTLSVNFIYIGDPEDAEAMENPDEAGLYREVLRQSEEEGYHLKNEKQSVIDRALAQEDAHDKMKFDVIRPVFKAYFKETGLTDSLKKAAERDRISKEWIKTLLPGHFGQYATGVFCYAVVGLIRSVAFVHPALNFFALLCYVGAVALFIVSWRRKGWNRSTAFMSIVLLCILGNVSIVSLVIMPLSRYMIYNLPFFYIALFLAARELFALNKDRTMEEAENRPDA